MRSRILTDGCSFALPIHAGHAEANGHGLRMMAQRPPNHIVKDFLDFKLPCRLKIRARTARVTKHGSGLIHQEAHGARAAGIDAQDVHGCEAYSIDSIFSRLVRSAARDLWRRIRLRTHYRPRRPQRPGVSGRNRQRRPLERRIVGGGRSAGSRMTPAPRAALTTPSSIWRR
jgi:hypothetical protein